MSHSIGFACYPFLQSKPDLFTWEEVFDIADIALYAAKNSGRNAWVGLSSPHFSQEIVTRCQRCPWMQGARLKPTQTYCLYIEESEGVQRSSHG